jgi:putative endonuclease
MTGAVGYHAGLCAEDIVASDYLRGGYELLERRWHGAGGEIDLIFGKGDAIIFVEVKKSRNFGTAAARVSPRQVSRIYASAGGYLATCPMGQDTESRFDVALVDGIGATEIIQNAFGL